MKKIDIAILTLMIVGIVLMVTGLMNMVTVYLEKPAINCLYVSDSQDPFIKKRFVIPINIKEGYIQYITKHKELIITNSTTLHLFNLCYKKYENNTNKESM